MANTCFTSVTVYAPNECAAATAQLESLYNELTELKGKQLYLGLDEVRDHWSLNDSIYCHGSIYDIDSVRPGKSFEILQEDAWYPRTEIWTVLLPEKYPLLAFVYIGEEFSCDIYCTNDVDKLFYKDIYSVDYTTDSGEEPYGEIGIYCYCSDEALLKDWSSRTGKQFESVSEFEEFISDLDDDIYISFHEISYEE